MMQRHLVGIDIGTTAVKTVLVDAEDGFVIAAASAQHKLASPAPGWSEENPEDWWRNVILTIRECLAIAGAEPRSVKGIGVSGMVPALVLLDARGTPLRPSIQQSDARTHNEIITLREAIDDERFFSIAGSQLNQQMIGPKILWLRTHEPGTLSAATRILGSYDFIVHRLTGEYSVERNWALESGLFDVEREDWSEELLELAGLDRSKLPAVHRPEDRVGTVTRIAAEATGLAEGTPVVAGTADHVSSAFMAGIEGDDDLLLKLGGAADILCATDRLVTDRRLYIDFHILPGKYLLNGCMASSGSIIEWLAKDILGRGTSSYAELDAAADLVPVGSEGIVILPYFIGEKTPILDPLARGVIFGITLHHTPAHIHRAIMEGVAYGFLHHIEVMRENGCVPRQIYVSNGGAVSGTWGRILSSVVGQRIHVLGSTPGSCLGAAFVAGMGVGCYESWAQARGWRKITHVIDPSPEEHSRYQRFYSLYRTLYAELKDSFAVLSTVAS